MSLLNELTDYSKACINDEIVSCKKLKWSCMRFLRDVERQETKDFPYVFVEDKALRYFDWMRLFKHTKGRLSGTFKEPHISEMFEFGNIYGWNRRDNDLRRFRYAYIQKARKNAKSQDLAITGLYEEAAFGESCSEVYVAASKKDQCRFVFDEADLIYRRCDYLKDKFTTRYGVIEHPKSGSRFARLSKDDRKSGSGGSPQCGILDEYHEHETAEHYDLMTSGMKTREQPILIIITTAGVDPHSPCADEYDYCSKILDPNNPIENDRYFVCIYELDKDDDGNLIDNMYDQSCWRKANPIIYNDPVAVENILAELELAKSKPDKKRDVITKTFDIWINERDHGYMPMDKWAACAATPDNPMPDVKGLEVVTGIDLSYRSDLSSVAHEIRLPDGRIAVMQKSFMPEETYEAVKDQPKAHWRDRKADDSLIITPGAVVDYDYILDYIDDVYDKNGWHKGELAFDRALATWLMQQSEKRGFIPAEIIQGWLTLGAPTKDFRDNVYDKKVIHDDPMLTWAMGNAICDEDKNKNVMLNKQKSNEKIDPAAALMNAHVRFVVKPKVNIYEERGMTSLL
jgi:phage terminase large subunit-like protein